MISWWPLKISRPTWMSSQMQDAKCHSVVVCSLAAIVACCLALPIDRCTWHNTYVALAFA
jgi:hypothetical protein